MKIEELNREQMLLITNIATQSDIPKELTSIILKILKFKVEDGDINRLNLILNIESITGNEIIEDSIKSNDSYLKSNIAANIKLNTNQFLLFSKDKDS